MEVIFTLEAQNWSRIYISGKEHAFNNFPESGSSS